MDYFHQDANLNDDGRGATDECPCPIGRGSRVSRLLWVPYVAKKRAYVPLRANVGHWVTSLTAPRCEPWTDGWSAVRRTVDLHPSSSEGHAARPAACHRWQAWLNPLSRSLGPLGLALSPPCDRCPHVHTGSGGAHARPGVGARVVVEAVVNVVLAGLGSLRPVRRGQRVSRQICQLPDARPPLPRVKHATRTPPTLHQRAVDCRSRTVHFLPSGTRAPGVARCPTS